MPLIYPMRRPVQRCTYVIGCDEVKLTFVQMLSAAAKECGIWLIGGSIPELPKTEEEQKHMSLNTMTVWDDQGENTLDALLTKGRMVGKYSKIHLYDVNIPGGIVFQVRQSDAEL